MAAPRPVAASTMAHSDAGDDDGDILMAETSARVPTAAAAGSGMWDAADSSDLRAVGPSSAAAAAAVATADETRHAVAGAGGAGSSGGGAIGGDADGDVVMGSSSAAVGSSGESRAPGEFMSRDERAAREQAAGTLTFQVISNDGERAHMIWLTQAKNIFAAQLPKMPREYIARLVYDRKHRTLIILKGGDRVVGGICYRPFPTQQFAEIAFLAISSSEQVKVRARGRRWWPDYAVERRQAQPQPQPPSRLR